MKIMKSYQPIVVHRKMPATRITKQETGILVTIRSNTKAPVVQVDTTGVNTNSSSFGKFMKSLLASFKKFFA